VLPRSAGKPILIGLGAAAILAAGAIPVLAAPPAPPEVPTSISTEASSVKVESVIRPPSGSGFTGVSVTATVGEAPATLSTACPGEDENPDDNLCDLSGVTAETAAITYTVKLTGDITKDTPVSLTVTATYKPADGEAEPAEPRTTVITFQAPEAEEPPPTPTPTPTATTKPPTKSPSPTKPPADDNNDDDGNSGGGSSSSGSSSSGSASGSGSGGSSYTPPAPNGSFGTAQNPRLALPPPIAPQNPSVAPQQAPTPESRLQNNKAPVAQDLTFERMASTQVAWLAALLVAFSVLLTQLRLGRRRNGSARALAATGRTVGSHRRPRRGLFGK
jgi:uncharacterized membrane protein YgcG